MSCIELPRIAGHGAQGDHRHRPGQHRAALGPPGQAHGPAQGTAGAVAARPGPAPCPPRSPGARPAPRPAPGAGAVATSGTASGHQRFSVGMWVACDPADRGEPDHTSPRGRPRPRAGRRRTANTISPAPVTARAWVNTWARHSVTTGEHQPERREPGAEHEAASPGDTTSAAARAHTPAPISRHARAVTSGRRRHRRAGRPRGRAAARCDLTPPPPGCAATPSNTAINETPRIAMSDIS